MASTLVLEVTATEPTPALRTALRYLHFASPIVLLFFFLGAFTVRSIKASPFNDNDDTDAPQLGPGGKPLPTKQPAHTVSKAHYQEDCSKAQKRIFEWISAAAACTFLANAASLTTHAVYKREEEWWCGEAVVIYVVASFFVYCLFVITLLDSKPAPTAAHLSTWTLALVLETVLLALGVQIFSQDHREPTAGTGPGRLRTHFTSWEITDTIINLFRVCFLLLLISVYLFFIQFKVSKKEDSAESSETTGLLNAENAQNGSANGYGAVPNGTKPANGHGQGHGHGAEAPAGWSRPTTTPSRDWWEYAKGYSVFFPYLWPSKDRRLQIIVVICFVLMILQRIVNIAVPDQVKRITDQLTEMQNGGRMPWGSICLYVLLRFLQGTNGILGAARATLWIPVGQYSYRELSVAAFEHVHSLSLDFHLGKKTGEVLSALGKGSSINTFLEQVTFSVLPMLIDLVLAIGYFLIRFDAYYALIIAVVTFWYVYLTIRMAQWRAEIRRQMVNADREEDAVKNDSMVSYETVKYFNAEAYEFNRYREAVDKYQKAEYKVMASLSLMNVTQNMVFLIGLMIACFIAAWQITTGKEDVGTFVMLLTYMVQLQSPLNFFGTFYRMIQSSMINSERMLELFKEQPTVVDKHDAKPLASCEGDIRFNDVHFAYDDRKPALQGLKFHCKPGTTTAFVGESGGGKSTVFRLMFRFYDTQSGHIQVDGHDVSDITIDSVRKHIGVVPQDTVLFNETVMYNLKYANPGVTDEEVHAACRKASIHDKIMSFPDGYETKVGDRGLRLSGGEKQRVAIARTILKNPRIIMLDEATAALDTETEQHIQEALGHLGTGRTMLVIAHRLSTITTADQILVLHEGRVAEGGTHMELMEKKGRYATMWKKQIKAQRVAEEAKALTDRAERLRRESKTGSPPNEEDNSSDEDKKKRNAQNSKNVEQPASSSASVPA